MAFYHLAVTLCAAVLGSPEHCESERMIDTQYVSLVSCYSAADKIDKQVTREFLEEARSHGDESAKLKVKTRCLTIEEGEALLKKEGPSALVITGKKFE
ncbi:hypothetical protein [Pseudomonas sp. 11/12A]|uniref:hypothetical protein n=1 Tax=Pseudomonas sp. 11/12A TaxID=1506582 RepID=UPI0006476954|nr:hypothetical protein [Pseudomonas sp. 11/12A]